MAPRILLPARCPSALRITIRKAENSSLPIGSIVVPFWGSYSESEKVIPKKNYYGAYGYAKNSRKEVVRKAAQGFKLNGRDTQLELSGRKWRRPVEGSWVRFGQGLEFITLRDSRGNQERG